MPVGGAVYPFAPCGHFKLVNLCRFDQDVPWMKAEVFSESTTIA